MEEKYITLSQSMGYVLPFASIMKNIEFVIELQQETPKYLWSLFENPFTLHKDNQGAITLVVSPQIWPCTNHIAIEYHHFWNFVTKLMQK